MNAGVCAHCLGCLADEQKYLGLFGKLACFFKKLTHCAKTEDVAAFAYGVDHLDHGFRSEIFNDRAHSCFACVFAGLVACDAIVCACVAQRAVVHCLGNVLVKLCSAFDHRDHQTSCARSPCLAAGCSGDGADMAAHPAESACVGLSCTVFRKHIKTSLSQNFSAPFYRPILYGFMIPLGSSSFLMPWSTCIAGP